jgi:hypothetical protein
MYYKLRDEKTNYLRKMCLINFIYKLNYLYPINILHYSHKIVFELEKRKIIEEKKQYRESRKMRNQEARFMLESIENSYKDKISILKEKLQQQRKSRHLAEVAHREVQQIIIYISIFLVFNQGYF